MSKLVQFLVLLVSSYIVLSCNGSPRTDQAKTEQKPQPRTERSISEWQDMSDELLVSKGGAIGGSGFQGMQLGPLIEMERRLKNSIKDFNEKSSEQAARIEQLTIRISWLTFVYTIAAVFQVVVAIVALFVTYKAKH